MEKSGRVRRARLQFKRAKRHWLYRWGKPVLTAALFIFGLPSMILDWREDRSTWPTWLSHLSNFRSGPADTVIQAAPPAVPHPTLASEWFHLPPAIALTLCTLGALLVLTEVVPPLWALLFARDYETEDLVSVSPAHFPDVTMNLWNTPQCTWAGGGTPGTLFRVSVPLQFHNSAGQPLTVHDVTARVVERATHRVVDAIRNTNSSARLDGRTGEVDMAKGIALAAGSSSDQYWFHLDLLVPRDFQLGREHVTEVIMRAMRQPETTMLIECPWGAAAKGTVNAELAASDDIGDPAPIRLNVESPCPVNRQPLYRYVRGKAEIYKRKGGLETFHGPGWLCIGDPWVGRVILVNRGTTTIRNLTVRIEYTDATSHSLKIAGTWSQPPNINDSGPPKAVAPDGLEAVDIGPNRSRMLDIAVKEGDERTNYCFALNQESLVHPAGERPEFQINGQTLINLTLKGEGFEQLIQLQITPTLALGESARQGGIVSPFVLYDLKSAPFSYWA